MARVLIIAGESLAIAAVCPADLDARLVTATGCGLHEIESLLDAGPDRIAHALMPLLDGEIELADLAGMIADDREAVSKVRALYADLPPLELSIESPGDVVIEGNTFTGELSGFTVEPTSDAVIEGNTFDDTTGPPPTAPADDPSNEEVPA